jgi:hypothetical protein
MNTSAKGSEPWPPENECFLCHRGMRKTPGQRAHPWCWVEACNREY